MQHWAQFLAWSQIVAGGCILHACLQAEHGTLEHSMFNWEVRTEYASTSYMKSVDSGVWHLSSTWHCTPVPGTAG